MLKLLGAALVLGGAALLGASAIGRLRERATVLDRLQSSLTWLAEELTFSLSPMPKLLEQLAGSQKGAVSLFYRDVLAGIQTDPEGGLRQSWHRAAAGRLGVLKEEELQVVRALGKTLGRYDGESQCQALRQTAGRLEQLRRQAQEDRLRLGRVYGALSVAGGVLAVIVLM